MGSGLPDRPFRALTRAALLLTALLFARPAAATDKIWKGAGVNALASNTANWFSGVVPTTGDHVIFGSTSPTRTCTWDLGVTISSIDFTGSFSSSVYLANDLSLSSGIASASGVTAVLDLHGHKVSIGGSLISDHLTFTSAVNGSTVTFTGSGAATASKSDGPLHFPALEINKGTNAILTVKTDTIVDSTFTMTFGTVTASNIAVNLKGDIWIADGLGSGSYMDVSMSSIVFAGSVPQQMNGNNADTGNFTEFAALYVQNATTVTVPGITVEVFVDTKPSSTFLIAGGGFSVGDMTITGGGAGSRITLASDTPGLASSMGALTAAVDYAAIRDIDASNGNGILATHSLDLGNNTNVTVVGGGPAIWKGGSGSLASTAANWVGGAAPTTQDFVTFGSTGPTLPCTWDLSVQLASFSVVGSYSGTITLSTDVFSFFGVRLAASAFSLDFGTHSIRDEGDFFSGGTLFGTAGSSVSLEGADPVSLGAASGSLTKIPGLSINKSAGVTVTASNAVNISSGFSVLSGTFTAGAFRHEIGGALNATGGYLDIHLATIAFSGTGLQSAALASASRASKSPAFYVQSPATTTFSGAWRTDLLIATTPASGAAFVTGASTMTIGTLQADGQAVGTRVMLSGPGSIKVTSGATIQNAWISGLNAASGVGLTAYYSLDGGGNTNWTILATSATLSGGQITALSSFSVTAAWTTSFPTGQTYLAQLSTGAFPNTFAGNLSSSTLNASATFYGLAPNTTFYAQVSTGGVQGFISAGSSATLSALPASPAYSAVFASSATLSWGANSNPADTDYVVHASSDGFNAIVSSRVTALTATVPGLAANTTYTFRVASIDRTGTTGSFVLAAATFTAADAPVAGSPSSVSSASFALSWLANGNSTGTWYGAEVSADPGFSVFAASGQVRALTAAFSGLTPNTSYYSRVRAIGQDGARSLYTTLPTTWTLTAPPAAAGTTFSGVELASATVSWAPGGNPGGTGYVVRLSSDAFADILFSSATYNLSATFGTTGAGPALTPNTTYAFQVQATTPTNSSAFTSLGSTVTDAAPPAAAATAFTAAGLTSLTVNWSSGSAATGYNPTDTPYLVQVSTSPADFSPVAASQQTTALSAALAGLAQNTTYYARVAALAAGTGAVGRYTTLGSTETTTIAPTASAFSGATASALTANWGANGNPAGTVYAVRVSTDPGFSVLAASASTTATSAAFSGLSANTSYYGQVAAYGLNAGAFTSFTTLGPASTLANAPVSPAIVSVDATDASLSWSANANSTTTVYEAQISTMPVFTLSQSSFVVATSAGFSGLSSNTTYYLRVRARANDGTLTSFAVAAATSTQAAAPLSAAPSGVTASGATANWTANGNSTSTFYGAQIATDGAFSAIVSSGEAQGLSAAFTGLLANTAYFLRVRARGNDGAYTAFTSLPSTSTLLASPAAAGTPFAAVELASATVQWATGANGPGTTYVAQISSDNFADVLFSSTTLNLSATFGTGGAGPALTPNTTYSFQVQATTTSNSSAFVALGSTVTDAAPPAAGTATFSAAGLTGFTVSWSSGSAATGYNPVTTSYRLQVSTSPADFSPVAASHQGTGLSSALTGLTQNTTYYARVAAIGAGTGAVGPFTALGSTATTTSAPAAAAFSGATASALTANWTANGNPSGTTYQIQLSSDPAFTVLAASAATTATSSAFAGLTANTTYYGQVAAYALNAGAYTSFTALGSTATTANAPASAVPSALSVSSVQLAWSANGNSAGTVYGAEISTDSFATLVQTSMTANTSAIFSGLQANATYFSRVRARQWNGTFSSYATAAATVTPVASPVTAPLVAVGSGSVTAAWGAGGNASGTQYDARISTDGFATTNAVTRVAATTAGFGGLSPNAAYDFQVRAVGRDGTPTAYVALPSTSTLLASPAAAGTPFTGVELASVTVQWASGGNSAGTTYVARVSSDAFADVLFSSVTQNLSATFGAGGAGPNLEPNTTYAFQVQATTTTNSSAFLALGSTVTDAAPPSAGAATFSAAGLTGFAVSWSSGSAATGYNPVTTSYRLQVSTSPADFSPVAASHQGTGLSSALTGLTQNTTYYARVAAIGAGTGAVGTYTALGSTATTTAAPAAAAFSGATTSGLTANWTANGNPSGTTYLIQLSTDPAFSTLTASAATTATSAAFSGLSANTTYYGQVAAYGLNAAAYTAFTALGGGATSANVPAGASASPLSVSSVRLTWSANGNGAGTLYGAEISTDSFATMVQSSATANTSATFLSLQANATYFLRVRARQWNGAFSAYTAAPATTTPVAVPVTAPLVAVGSGSVTAAWGANGNASGTQYDARVSTDAFATFNASVRVATTTAGFGGLAPNTNYGFEVRAVGHDGTLTSFVVLPSTTTTLLPPAAAAVSFPQVSHSSLTVAWATGGNGPGTTYRVQLSTDAFATVSVGSDTANLSALFGTGGAGSPLPADTTYQARVLTFNGGNTSAFVSLGSTGTLAADPAGPAASSATPTTITLNWTAGGNPADTLYQAQASTNSFATVSKNVSANAVSATFTSLVPNTAYQLRVRAVARAGTANAYVAAPATATFAALPLAPAAAFSVNAATLTWSAAGNPATTGYDAQLSTDAFATVSRSSSVAAAKASFTGLTANVTYYLRARASGLSGVTPFVSASAGATLPQAPAAPSASASGATASLSWVSSNPSGSLYEAQLSTNSFSTVNASSVTANLSASFAGLQSNATYYLRARTRGWAADSAFTASASTTTPVAVPVSSGPAFVSTGSISAAWGANGNAAGTLYEARISTDGFATYNSAKKVAAVTAAFLKLASNQNYDFEVRAIGRNGTLTAFVALPSTTTLLLPPAVSTRPFPLVGVSSLTVAWNSGGNGAGTNYRVELSTDAFATVTIGSDTLNLSAVFGTGGQGAPLALNTTYQARVLTFNGPHSSLAIPLGSTSTFALAPSGTFVVAATSQTVSLDWSAAGNPEPGTSYQLQRDVTSGFTAPKTTTVSSSAATIAGLSMASTYYFRVRAVSAAGAPTGYDAFVATVTLPAAPGQPGRPVATPVGAATLSWGWTPALLASSYRLYADTSATVLLGVQTSTTFVQAGLGPNASSFLLVAGVNTSGQGPLSAPGLGWTPANPPTGTAVTGVWATSATVVWALNGNPAYTTAEIQTSPTGSIYTALSTSVAGTSYTAATLESCTPYYLRVRNNGGGGDPTTFDSVVQFTTMVSTPLAPTALSAKPLAGLRVALAWTPSPTSDVISYRLYTDAGAGTIAYGAPYATFTSTETSFTTPPLVSSAAYAFALRAVNHCGNEEKNTTTRAASAAAAAPAAVAAAVRSPEGGRHVYGDRVTVSAALTSGALSAVSKVLFQYRLSGAGAWTDVVAAAPAHPNPVLAAPFFTQWDVTGLASGDYELRGVAYDLASSSDPAASATTVSVDPAAPDVVENDIGGGRSRRDQTVYASVANTIFAGGLGAGEPLAKLVLPAGALGTSTATLSLISGPDLTGISTSAAGAQSAGLFARVDLSNAQSNLSGGRTASLTLSYPDDNNDGIVDGTGLTASNLMFYSYNAVAGTWRQDLTTSFDPASRTVTGATPHFSLFGVFAGAAAASTLDTARAYPVPFRPNGPNPDEGRPYAAGVPNTGIVFDGLPANARIKIYSVDGRLVADLQGGSTAVIQWDARNGEGRDVATGGYFAVISSPGLRSVVRRLSIIR